MKIMVIGSGGREHTIIRALKKSKGVDEIYVLPGNAGMKRDATCVAIGAKDIPAQVQFAKENDGTITRGDVMELLHLTRSQAYNLLKKMVDDDKLDSKGTTRNAYYILKV